MFESRARHAGFRAHDRSQSFGRGTSKPISILALLRHLAPAEIAGRPRMMLRCSMLVLAALAFAAPVDILAEDVRAAVPDDESRVLSRASDFPKGWTFYSAEPDVKLGDVWRARAGDTSSAGDADDVLICTGKPFGYLKTESAFENFELSLEWSYPEDPNCNSGILMCTNGDDRIWPTSIQVQLHRPTAGSIFPIGDARVDKNVHVKSSDLAVAQWHKCVIRCEGGRIAVSVNGADVGRVPGCTPRRGAIALQSEGAEIHFRRITLKRLDR